MTVYIDNVVLPQLSATEGTPAAAEWHQAWVRLASAIASTSHKDAVDHVYQLVRWMECVAIFRTNLSIFCLVCPQLATEPRLQTADALVSVLKVAVSHRDWKHTSALLALLPSGAATDEATQTALLKLVSGIFELAARTADASAANIHSALQHLRAHGVAMQDDATAAVLEALAHKGDIEQLRLGYSTLVDMNAQPTSSTSVPVKRVGGS